MEYHDLGWHFRKVHNCAKDNVIVHGFVALMNSSLGRVRELGDNTVLPKAVMGQSRHSYRGHGMQLSACRLLESTVMRPTACELFDENVLLCAVLAVLKRQ